MDVMPFPSKAASVASLVNRPNGQEAKSDQQLSKLPLDLRPGRKRKFDFPPSFRCRIDFRSFVSDVIVSICNLAQPQSFIGLAEIARGMAEVLVLLLDWQFKLNPELHKSRSQRG